MTQFRTLRRRIDGAYDHPNKRRRLRKAILTQSSNTLGGRKHKKYLRSAIARQFWVMRSRREPFPFDEA
jgi:hypothetical protein